MQLHCCSSRSGNSITSKHQLQQLRQHQQRQQLKLADEAQVVGQAIETVLDGDSYGNYKQQSADLYMNLAEVGELFLAEVRGSVRRHTSQPARGN